MLPHSMFSYTFTYFYYATLYFSPPKSIFNPIPRLGHLFSSSFPLKSNFHPDVGVSSMFHPFFQPFQCHFSRWPRSTGPTASNAGPCNVPRAWSKRIIARWSDSSRSDVPVISSCVLLSTVFWSLLYDLYIYIYVIFYIYSYTVSVIYYIYIYIYMYSDL